jgi:hypothetical protein
MKNFKLITLIFITIVLNACDKSSNDHTTSNPTLNGIWKLVKVTGDFVGSVSQFQKGTISWEFNESTKKIIVTNLNTNSDLADILKTGTYDYVTINNANTLFCEKSITINNIDLGCLTFINGNLRIDKSFLDGPRLDFVN